MSTPMKLDEFLGTQSSQNSGFTATLEPIPDKPNDILVTPFQEDGGCGCSSAFTLARDMIRSVTPTGRFHHCCGKRLEIVAVEFAEDATVPVADLMNRAARASAESHGGMPHQMAGQMAGGQFPQMSGGHFSSEEAYAARRGAGLVGRWPIPGSPCDVTCIEVCTRFCGPTGWACCQWETECGVNCNRAVAF